VTERPAHRISDAQVSGDTGTFELRNASDIERKAGIPPVRVTNRNGIVVDAWWRVGRY
jgi:hypothetical protein